IQSADGTLASAWVCGKSVFLPAEIAQATVRAARHFTLSKNASAATVSATTTALVTEAMRAMMVTKLKLAGAAAVLVGLLTCAIGGLAAAGTSQGSAAKARAQARIARAQADLAADLQQPTKPAGKQAGAITFRGHVVGPDGKPADGATVYTL